MKLSTKQLRTALADAGRCIRGKSALLTGGVRLASTESQLGIEATNLDSWITRRVPCSGVLPAVMLPHRKLSEVIANVFSEEVELKVDGNKVVIQGVGTTSIARLPIITGDFQSASSQGFAPLAVVPNDLADGLESVQWAADKAESASVQTQCVTIDMQPTFLNCAAMTRGILYARFRRPLICEERKISIPATSINMILSDLRADDAMVEASDNLLRVEHSGGSAVIKMSQHPPLPYEHILNKRDGLKGTFLDRETLRRGCSYAIMFAKAGDSPTLNVARNGDGVVRISCGGGDEAYSEEIEAPGEPIKFTVPANQLAGCLDKSMADEVNVMMLVNAVFIEIRDNLYAIAAVGVDNKVAP